MTKNRFLLRHLKRNIIYHRNSDLPFNESPFNKRRMWEKCNEEISHYNSLLSHTFTIVLVSVNFTKLSGYLETKKKKTCSRWWFCLHFLITVGAASSFSLLNVVSTKRRSSHSTVFAHFFTSLSRLYASYGK